MTDFSIHRKYILNSMNLTVYIYFVDTHVDIHRNSRKSVSILLKFTAHNISYQADIYGVAASILPRIFFM